MQDLKVAILWHFHQPTYWDPRISSYRYPWVFLHTVRHYHAMGRIAEAHPEMAMAFNFTPVLLEQMEHYVENGPRDDRLLEAVLKPASDLSEGELTLVLDHAFKLHLPTMVFPFPRFRELHALLGDTQSPSHRRKVTSSDVRDIQTLYLLTWCGIPLRESEPVQRALEKREDYSEEDKQAVFAAMLQAARETLPLFRDLQERGQVEITTTPYYHPILPLLIDSASARESRPDVDLTEIDFRYPEDARWHVEEAVKSYRKNFQGDPVGMWPAEGGVSDETLELLNSCGILWAATDEGVLGRSLGSFPPPPEEKYLPYRFSDTNLWLYFRDRELSDRIGFVYSGWNPVKAAEDVIHRILSTRDHLPDKSGDHCYTIVLDGENPWEYYRDSGLAFLTKLYDLLSTTRGIEPIRFCDHRRQMQSGPKLHHVVPGSWIDSNFDTWIGGPQKNHAWKTLTSCRRALATEKPRAEVPTEFYRAEGSDWFWWLGPGHDTPYEASYDDLFRLNLRLGLEKAAVTPPSILDARLATFSSPGFQPPTHLSTPKIDGKRGGYYDWIAAGHYRASEGSFHRSRRVLETLRFTFDLENLYLRVEGDMTPLEESQGAFVVQFKRPEERKVVFSKEAVDTIDAEGQPHTFSGEVGLEQVLEIRIPFEFIGAKTGDIVEFFVSAVVQDNTVDRLPQSGFVVMERPHAGFGQENWSV